MLANGMAQMGAKGEVAPIAIASVLMAMTFAGARHWGARCCSPAVASGIGFMRIMEWSNIWRYSAGCFAAWVAAAFIF